MSARHIAQLLYLLFGFIGSIGSKGRRLIIASNLKPQSRSALLKRHPRDPALLNPMWARGVGLPGGLPDLFSRECIDCFNCKKIRCVKMGYYRQYTGWYWRRDQRRFFHTSDGGNYRFCYRCFYRCPCWRIFQIIQPQKIHSLRDRCFSW